MELGKTTKVKNTTKANKDFLNAQGLKTFGPNGFKGEKYPFKDTAYNILSDSLVIDNNSIDSENLNTLSIGSMLSNITANLFHNGSSKIIMDYCGTYYKKYGEALRRKAKVFSIDYEKDGKNDSDYYNPLHFVYDKYGNIDEVMVEKITDTLLKCMQSKVCCTPDNVFALEDIRHIAPTFIYYILENNEIVPKDKCFYTIRSLLLDFTHGRENAKNWAKIQEFCEKHPYSYCAKSLPDMEFVPNQSFIKAIFNIWNALECFNDEPDCWPNDYDGNYKWSKDIVDLTLLPELKCYLFINIPLLGLGASYGYANDFKLQCLLMQAMHFISNYSGEDKYYHMMNGNFPIAPFNSFDEAERFQRDCKEYGNFKDNKIIIARKNDYYYLIWEDRILLASECENYLGNIIYDVKYNEPVITSPTERGAVSHCQIYMTDFDMNLEKPVFPDFWHYYCSAGNRGWSFHIFVRCCYMEKETEMYRVNWKKTYNNFSDLETLFNCASVIVVRKINGRPNVAKYIAEKIVCDNENVKAINNIKSSLTKLDKQYLIGFKNLHLNCLPANKPYLIDDVINFDYDMFSGETYGDKTIAINTSDIELPDSRNISHTLLDSLNVEDKIKNLHLDIKNTFCMPEGSKGLFTYVNGRLEDMDVNFIACPMNDDFSGGAKVASMLFSQGGDILMDIFKFLKEKDILKRTILTPLAPSGHYGTLKARRIAFVLMRDNINADSDTNSIYQSLYEAYLSCYEAIADFDIKDKSIALPLLGTGAGNLPYMVSAEAAINAFNDISKKYAINVTLVAFNDDAYKGIENAMRFVAFKDAVINIISKGGRN